MKVNIFSTRYKRHLFV